MKNGDLTQFERILFLNFPQKYLVAVFSLHWISTCSYHFVVFLNDIVRYQFVIPDYCMKLLIRILHNHITC